VDSGDLESSELNGVNVEGFEYRIDIVIRGTGDGHWPH